MKKLLLLMIVSMLATTAVMAEEDLANSEGADCGERISKVIENDSASDKSEDSEVKQEG